MPVSRAWSRSSATAQRSAYAFQADATDGQVADLRMPYEYILPYFFVTGQPTFTANTAADQVELPASSSYGDGVGRDVAQLPHVVEHFGISIVEAMSDAGSGIVDFAPVIGSVTSCLTASVQLT